MRMALFGLGKMGANMARRLLRGGIEVIGYNRSQDIVQQLQQEEGLLPAASVVEAIRQLPNAPRVVWLMLPAGEVTDTVLEQAAEVLEQGDILIDGSNANYHHSIRRGKTLAAKGIHFIDAGVSGGVWGLKEGYCLMVGGEPAAVDHVKNILQVLAPSPEQGWAHVGPVGAGHYTKMIHNGIEYGMMQAYAEGLSLLKGKNEFNIDLAQVTELWRHGSVVRSWLLDLTADFLKQDQQLTDVAPYVADSGEGRWTVAESIDQGVAAPVLTLALQMRFASQDQEGYGNRLLAMMRHAFGGHNVKDQS
jgi:6-phosphogluconate dehydrogenase